MMYARQRQTWSADRLAHYVHSHGSRRRRRRRNENVRLLYNLKTIQTHNTYP